MVHNKRQQEPPHLVFALPRVKVRTKVEHHCQTRAHGTAHIAYILQDKGWDMAHTLHQL
jgi:hypothetical protein